VVRADAAFCATCGARAGSSGGATTSTTAEFTPPPPPGESATPVAGSKSRSGKKLKYRGLVVRFVASMLDGIVFLAAGWLMAGALGLGAVTSEGFELGSGPSLELLLAALAYYVVLEGVFGWTIGKLVCGIRVVNGLGKAPGIGASLVRNLLRILDALPAFYLIGIISVLASDKKQRVGDRLAGTFVVSRP
jgi:uncharacterized RDD family membrane protein YckC